MNLSIPDIAYTSITSVRVHLFKTLSGSTPIVMTGQVYKIVLLYNTVQCVISNTGNLIAMLHHGVDVKFMSKH